MIRIDTRAAKTGRQRRKPRGNARGFAKVGAADLPRVCPRNDKYALHFSLYTPQGIYGNLHIRKGLGYGFGDQEYPWVNHFLCIVLIPLG